MAQYDVDLRDYWRIIRKRRFVVIAMALLVAGFSYLFSRFTEPPPIFESQAAVKIERRTTSAEYFMGFFWDMGDSISTQAQIIKSFPVLYRTAEKLEWLPPGLSPEEIQTTPVHLQVIQRLGNMIQAYQEGNTNILNIRAVSSNPQRAAAVANAVAITYREYNVREKNKQIFETKEFIEEQLGSTETHLRAAEDALKNFKEESGIVAPDIQTANTLNRLFALESTYEGVDQDIRMIASLLERVDAAENAPEALGTVFLPGAENSSSLIELSKKLRDLITRRKTLLFEYTEEHPDVIEINDQIQGLLFGIRKELLSRLSAIETQRADLEKEIAKLQEKNRAFPERTLRLNRLQREVSLQESLFSQLKTKYQEVLIQAAGRVEEVSIIRPALVPGAPTNIPSKVNAVAAGLFMGLFIGILFAFVAETLDTSLGTIEDVEDLLDVPVLGAIPHMSGDERGKRGRTGDLVVHFDPRSLAAEGFRSVRTNLEAAAGVFKGSVFMLTSSFLQEGKTFNGINIALILAQEGSRVLLVEADLRNPQIHHVFGLEKYPGLSDYVLGTEEISGVIRTVTDLMLGDIDLDDILSLPGFDNLHFVTSGSEVVNPNVILRSRRFAEFMLEARKNYDVILLDAPPVLPVADSMDIAPLADGVILIYSAGRIGRGVLKRAKSALDHVNANVIGVILNNVKPETGPDYFQYQSGYYPQEGRNGKGLRRWGIGKGGAGLHDSSGRPGRLAALLLWILLLLLLLLQFGPLPIPWEWLEFIGW